MRGGAEDRIGECLVSGRAFGARSRAMGTPCPDTPKTNVERVPQPSLPGVGVVVAGGSRLPEGHVGASDGPLGRPETLKWPISYPGARAGVIWLETGGAGESYKVGYPDGHRGDGACRAA